MRDFTFEFVSRNEYEFLAVELSYRGQLLCEISSERGVDRLEVEFARDFLIVPKPVDLRFPVNELLVAFHEACTALVAANGALSQTSPEQ
jgi:hypothetical protein